MWHLVFAAGLVVYVGIRATFERRVRGTPTRLSRCDLRERVLLAAVALGALVLPVVQVATPWLGFADYAQPAAAPWIGCGLMVAGLWLFWRSHADLGTNWSVTLEVRQAHVLVEHGVYRRIRHPMYAAIALFSVAQGLLLANWLAGWAACAAGAAMFVSRVPREERLMLETFGDAYQRYMQRTGRLLPRWRRGRGTPP